MPSRRRAGVPAYIQIATLIRHRIASAELKPGDLLPSLRAGATLWKVNLHTVRQAYLALERDGFITTSERRSARVATPSTSGLRAEIQEFLDWVITTAAERFALEPADIAAHLLARPSDHSPSEAPIWLLECSEWLAASLADQVAAAISRPVHPWPVQRVRQVPPGRVLSTYYHLPEVQGALAGRPELPRFLAVQLDEDNLGRLVRALDRTDGRLIVCGVDHATAQAMAEDLQAAIGPKASMDIRIARNPRRLLAKIPAGTPILVSPQHWDRLTSKERSRPGVFPLALRVHRKDLGELAREWGPTPRRRSGASRRRARR